MSEAHDSRPDDVPDGAGLSLGVEEAGSPLEAVRWVRLGPEDTVSLAAVIEGAGAAGATGRGAMDGPRSAPSTLEMHPPRLRPPASDIGLRDGEGSSVGPRTQELEPIKGPDQGEPQDESMSATSPMSAVRQDGQEPSALPDPAAMQQMEENGDTPRDGVEDLGVASASVPMLEDEVLLSLDDLSAEVEPDGFAAGEEAGLPGGLREPRDTEAVVAVDMDGQDADEETLEVDDVDVESIDVEEVVEELDDLLDSATEEPEARAETAAAPASGGWRPAPPPVPAGGVGVGSGELGPGIPQDTPVRHSPPGVDDAEDPALASLVNDLLEAEERRTRRTSSTRSQDAGRSSRPWFEDVFDESWLRTLPVGFHAHTVREARFLADSLGLDQGARVLDVGCGFGRHALLLAEKGYDMVGLDLSLSLLQKALAEAQRRGLTIRFIHGDMRDLHFERVFDGAYCVHTTFGYFDDATNLQVLRGITRSIRTGGRIVVEVLNRDWLLDRLPRRVWWEGGDYLFLEDVEFDFRTSRLHMERTVVDETDDPHKQFISMRAYSLHEVRGMLEACGFRVMEQSGDYTTRGAFLGTSSRHVIVTAERED